MRHMDRRTEIRVWMMRRGLRQIDVARTLGVAPPVVCRWINGQMTSRRIARFFHDNGLPEQLLRAA